MDEDEGIVFRPMDVFIVPRSFLEQRDREPEPEPDPLEAAGALARFHAGGILGSHLAAWIGADGRRRFVVRAGPDGGSLWSLPGEEMDRPQERLMLAMLASMRAGERGEEPARLGPEQERLLDRCDLCETERTALLEWVLEQGSREPSWGDPPRAGMPPAMGMAFLGTEPDPLGRWRAGLAVANHEGRP